MAEPVHIAYLSHDGLTDPLGQSQILPYILGLEEKGFAFVIISFEKPEAFARNNELIISSTRNRNIKWIPLMYHKKPSVLATLFDIYSLRKTILIEHRKKPFKIIHCRSYITSLIGLWMKRKKKTKFIFDMRGFWADERVEGGLWNLKNPLYRLIYNYFKKKERQFIAESDQVVSLTENAKQEILSWRVKASPITVIPTCVDLELFDPEKIRVEDQENLRAQLGIKKEDFILLYLGSWGTWYLTKEMLDFFLALRKYESRSKFLVVSSDKIDLTSNPDRQDIITTQAPRHLVPLYISLADASVFFIKSSYSKKASSATKLGEIMAMNVPVITNRGWGDVEQLIDGGLCSDSATIKQHGLPMLVKARHYCYKKLSLKAAVESYRLLYENLMSQ